MAGATHGLTAERDNGPIIVCNLPGQVLAELAAEPIKVAKDPGAGQRAGICGEESGPGVFEPPPGGWQLQQHAGVRTGVPHRAAARCPSHTSSIGNRLPRRLG